MCWEDFIKQYSRITVCFIKPWQHMRLKGKFIRVEEKEKPEHDWVISKFCYSFKLEEDSQAIIALHQEDGRILGSEKRPTLDMGFAVLKQEEDDSLTLETFCDHEVSRVV